MSLCNAPEKLSVIPVRERHKECDRSIVCLSLKTTAHKFYFAKLNWCEIFRVVGIIRKGYPADLADLAVWSSGDSI